MSSPREDLDLDRYLEGDTPLSQIYRDGAQQLPPMHLDAAVLGAARAAVAADAPPGQARYRPWAPFARRWALPTVLATVVVAATLSVMVSNRGLPPGAVDERGASGADAGAPAERSYFEPLPPVGEAGKSSAASTPPAQMPASDAAPMRRDAPAARSAPAGRAAPPAAAPLPGAGALQQDSRAGSGGRVLDSESATAPPAPQAAAVPAAPPPPSAGTRQEGSSLATPPAAAPAQPAPGPPAAAVRGRELEAIRDQAQSRERSQLEQARRALEETERTRDAFEAKRARIAEERDRLENVVRSGAGDAVQDADGAGADGAALGETAGVLERIRALLAAGERAQARALLEALLAARPDTRVPQDLREALAAP